MQELNMDEVNEIGGGAIEPINFVTPAGFLRYLAKEWLFSAAAKGKIGPPSPDTYYDAMGNSY